MEYNGFQPLDEDDSEDEDVYPERAHIDEDWDDTYESGELLYISFSCCYSDTLLSKVEDPEEDRDDNPRIIHLLSLCVKSLLISS